MSLFDYEASRRISGKGYDFYPLLMAAMRVADSSNIEKLRAAFPVVHAELLVRYNALDGRIPEDDQ